MHRLIRFYVDRNKDETGVSRTGRIISGAIYPSGACIVEWMTGVRSVSIYPSFYDFHKIHIECHPSCNTVTFYDALPSPAIDGYFKDFYRLKDVRIIDETGKIYDVVPG